MKTLLLTTLAILLSTVIFAQAPQAFKYQAVIRNNQGKVLVNQQVSLQISILQNSPLGDVVYIETHQIYTNEYGIANLSIGSGDVITGVFADIAWGTTTHFVKTELDITGNQNYEFIGTSQLLSVPYAMYAKEAGNAADDFDKDSLNEIQDLQLIGNLLTITKNGTATEIDLTPYLDNTDLDEQTLSLNGNELSISNGNTIQLPPDSDGDTLNEIQTLSVSNNQLTISKGNTVNIDTDITNEIQVLSFSNDTLYLTNSGEIYLGDYIDNTDNQNLTINGNQLSISGGNSVIFSGTVDLDADPINELQALSYSNDTIYLSQGNFVVLPHNFDNDSLNEIQTLTQVSNIVTLSKNGGQININDADSDSLNEIQTLSISNDTVYLSSGGYVKIPISGFNIGGVNNLNDYNLNNNILNIMETTNDISLMDYVVKNDSVSYIIIKNLGNTSLHKITSDSVIFLESGGGTNSFIYEKLTLDQNNNLIAGGWYRNATGNSQIYYCKYDDNNNKIYEKYGASGYLTCIYTDTSNNVLLGSLVDNKIYIYYNNGATSQFNIPDRAVSINVINNNLYILTYNCSIYKYSYSGIQNNYLTLTSSQGIILNTKNNNLYFICRFSNTLTVGSNSFTSYGSSDFLIIKADTFFNVLNIVQISGRGVEAINSLEINDEIIVSGSFQQNLIYQNYYITSVQPDLVYKTPFNLTIDDNLNYLDFNQLKNLNNAYSGFFTSINGQLKYSVFSINTNFYFNGLKKAGVYLIKYNN